MLVNCSTVRPAYSAATSECALAATSASSATTSFFWFRFRAIALPLLLQFRPGASTPGQAMVRIDPSTRGTPWEAFHLAAVFQEPVEPITGGRQPSAQALSCFRSPGLSGLAHSGGDSVPFRASVPVAAAASTAPAVFDGSGPGSRPRRCPQNLLPGRRANRAAREVHHFRLSEDWSTVTPGPIVELIETFCRYWPLAVAGLALIRSASRACRFSFRRSGSKSALPIVQWMMPALSVR